MNSITQFNVAKTNDLVTRAAAEAAANAAGASSSDEAIRALRTEVERLKQSGQTAAANGLVALFQSATNEAVDAIAGDVMSGKLKTTAGPSGTTKRDLSTGGAPAGRTAMLRPTLGSVDARHTVVDDKGIAHPTAYDSTQDIPSVAKRWMREAMSMGDVRRKFKVYKKRVNAIVNAITDKELAWSLSRFDALATQEGILRTNNASLVHQWPNGHLAFKATPGDFANSTLSRETLIYLFKQAMDREEPAERYGWAAARALHDRFHRVAHFMGSTLGERVLKVALKGTPGNVQMGSVWIQEEARHGDVMEACYNAIRLPNEPELKQQGINSVMRPMSDAGAKSMMLARALAELGAATAYLTLKANADADSNADKALQGIFLDEVYHYVLMRAANIVGYQLENRYLHIINMLKDSVSYNNQEANDAAVYRLPEFLMIMEAAYAFNAIDKRVDKFLKGLTKEQLRASVGPVYPKQDQLDSALADGNHARTIPYMMEQNPDLSEKDVRLLEMRFPGDYKLENRRIHRNDIDAILLEYRSERLSNPKYWMAKKGFEDMGDGTLVRHLEDGDGTMTLRFKGRGQAPDVTVEGDHFVSFQGNIDTMTMREIGAVIDATGAKQFVATLRELEKTDFERTNPVRFYEEIVKNLGPNPAYQANPLKLFGRVTSMPKAS